jgi:hypothetical protein
MKIKIEIGTSYCEYNVFTWSEEDEEKSSDELKKKVSQFLKASGSKKEQLAESLAANYGDDAIDPEAYFRSIYVSYPDGEREDEYISPEESVENDNEQFFKKKFSDLTKNRIVICTMNQYKHGGWETTVESKNPFNINALSVINGEITYGFDSLDNMGGGDHNYGETWWEVDNL